MTKKACIYIRVSSEAQASDERASLREQEADCRGLCESKDYEVVAVLSDVASGATKKRPQFQRMLDGIREGEFDVVIAWSTDRFSRSIYATAALMEALEGRRCEVECAREAVDLDMLALHAAVGQVELRRIKERTSMGKRGAAKAGRLPSGQSVYGYRAGTDKKPEIHPDEAPIVRRWFKDYASGVSTKKIAESLDAEGVLPRYGGRWSSQYISIRLRDRVYTGHGAYGKARHERTEDGTRVTMSPREEWIDLPHPPLIDDALFARVQMRLASRRSRGLQPRSGSRRDFLLRGLLRCTGCEKGFVCRHHKRDDHRWYECLGTFRLKAGCRQKPQSIRAELLEDVVWSTVVEWVTQPELLEQAVEAQVGALRERGAYADLQDMQRSLKKLTTEEDRIITLCGRGKISEAQMGRQMRNFTERREHYEQRIVVLESEARQAEHQLERVQDFKSLCSELAPRLDNLGFEDRVKLVQAVVDSVTVDPENNVSIHIAVFPERLPVKSDVATVPTCTL